MSIRALIRFTTAMVAVYLLVAVTGGSARADISIAGGTPGQQLEVRTVFNALPLCCQTSCTVCVRILDDQLMDRYLSDQAAVDSVKLVNAGSIDGLYQNSVRTVTLRASSPGDDVTATFAHEYGHFVWLNVLSKAQRTQYERIYQDSKRSNRLVSSYAAVSVDEGFAESFSYHLREGSILQSTDPASNCFLTNTLGLAAPCSN